MTRRDGAAGPTCGNTVDSRAETVFTTDMTSPNFADTTNYSIGSVGGYLCLPHLNVYEVAYGLPRTGDVPTGRTGEDSLDAERDNRSGAVPVGARSPHTTTCFSRLPGGNPCDCKARVGAWR